MSSIRLLANLGRFDIWQYQLYEIIKKTIKTCSECFKTLFEFEEPGLVSRKETDKILIHSSQWLSFHIVL
ncbi:uncharacterized protein PHALS_14685 [Plasmopara halstedii]|uniref:Uncharacterized protein n=1 Tax=Plasmopara halstedii TaxID=4781 RepID=A0A0P1AQF1_PLAHL|nr:uncharacterized protein PHALS_14685 [Plasmopara halstedii]CEG43080.1 hypothetical protein PHALS_14685 [Plasmopara halstedii]|eukprot:XP_024579449.1 hypothetical protein PHALS_14685 [Plasmopara halstedii]